MYIITQLYCIILLLFIIKNHSYQNKVLFSHYIKHHNIKHIRNYNMIFQSSTSNVKKSIILTNIINLLQSESINSLLPKDDILTILLGRYKSSNIIVILYYKVCYCYC